MAKPADKTTESARTPTKPSDPKPTTSSKTSHAGTKSPGANEPEKLQSPLKPLLWLLIPLILILVYGFLGSH